MLTIKMENECWRELSVNARWSVQRNCYVVPARAIGNRRAWYSADGDIWTDHRNELITGARFDAATIRLVGGPRDGKFVG